MQIKYYSLIYLSSYLITIYCFSTDSYSFNYSPKPCDLQKYNLLDLQPHNFLRKISDDSLVILSDSPSDAPYEILSEPPSNAPSEIPLNTLTEYKVPKEVLSNKKINLLDNIFKLFFK